MRAAMNTTYGAPTVLSTTEVSRPAIGDHDVLVEVHASAVTQGDRRLRAADYPGISRLLGRLMTGLIRPRHTVPGTMFAGRVAAVGNAVTRFREGEDVFGSAMRGAQAEYLAMPEDGAMAHMPANLGYAEAAATPYGAGTALVFLRDLAKVQRGERVLIVGASGGVGRFVVQLAHHLGAEVTAVCSRDQDLVRALGADHVINYTEEDFTQNGQRYDVILDTHEGNRFRRNRGSLTPRGRYLSLYMSAGLLLQMLITAIFGGRRAITGVAIANAEQMEAVQKLVAAGGVRPVIARRFGLEQIAEAHTFLEASRPRGTVVVDVASAATVSGEQVSRLATRRVAVAEAKPQGLVA